MAALLTRVVFISLALVVIFAAIFTWVDAGPGWPDLPPNFGHRLDFFVGLGFCAAVVIWALRRGRPGSEELG